MVHKTQKSTFITIIHSIYIFVSNSQQKRHGKKWGKGWGASISSPGVPFPRTSMCSPSQKFSKLLHLEFVQSLSCIKILIKSLTIGQPPVPSRAESSNTLITCWFPRQPTPPCGYQGAPDASQLLAYKKTLIISENPRVLWALWQEMGSETKYIHLTACDSLPFISKCFLIQMYYRVGKWESMT